MVLTKYIMARKRDYKGRILPYDTTIIPDRLLAFKKHLIITRSKRSAVSYFTWLKKFEEFLIINDVEIGDVPPIISQEFINHLADQEYKPNTITLARIALKRYSKWLHSKNIIKQEFNDPETPKNEFRKKFKPTEEQVNKILKSVETLKDPTRTVILLFPLLGLRVSELVEMKLDQYSIRRELNEKENKMQTIFVVTGKGNKERSVPLSEKANNIIVNYLRTHRANIKSLWLFPSPVNHSKHITSENIQKTIRGIRDDLNVPELTSHAFRRFFGSLLNSRNVPLATIATLLGHKNIQTTYKHYIEPDSQELMNAIKGLNNQ